MTSANKEPEKSATNQPKKNENMKKDESVNKEAEKSATNQPKKNENTKKDEGDIALDPNPAKALTELVTGSENTTPKDESS